MNLSSLMSRTSSCNPQPGADQTKTPTFPEAQSALVIRTKLSNKTMVTHTHTQTIFDTVVTIFFRLQRKLEGKILSLRILALRK